MKTYPMKLFEFERDGHKIRVALKSCPFCGEALEAENEWHLFVEKQHEMWECTVSDDLPTEDPGYLVAFPNGDLDIVGFARDVDGDYWVFIPYTDYEITKHNLRPTSKGDLLKHVNKAISKHKRLMDECEVVRRILG